MCNTLVPMPTLSVSNHTRVRSYVIVGYETLRSCEVCVQGTVVGDVWFDRTCRTDLPEWWCIENIGEVMALQRTVNETVPQVEG